jgi:hypothetical protein
MRYRVVLQEIATGNLVVVDSWQWERAADPKESGWKWGVNTQLEPGHSLGFERYDDAEMAADYITRAHHGDDGPLVYRVFQIQQGGWPTREKLAQKRLAEERLELAKTRPWLRDMGGPRGPLIPG